jgi:hypothetical protein
VVIEKIDQHSPIKTEGWIEPALAAKKIEVLACKGVDFSVQYNPPCNTGRETPVELPFDKVTHKVSYKEFRSVSGEKKVSKKVHKPISYPSPFPAAREKKNICYNNTFRLIDQESLLDGNS